MNDNKETKEREMNIQQRDKGERDERPTKRQRRER